MTSHLVYFVPAQAVLSLRQLLRRLDECNEATYMICPIPPVSGSFRTLSSTTVQHLLTTMSSGDPESSQPFLAFTEESEASTPVFQLLHHIKWDVEVSGR